MGTKLDSALVLISFQYVSRVAQWWERSPPTNVARVQIPMWVAFVVGSLPCFEWFFFGFSGFPFPRKPTFSNSNSARNEVGDEPLCGCTTSKSLFILCINFIYLFYVSLQGQYSPSYILCPETYNWIPIEQCRPKIALAKYSRLDDSEEGNACIIF